MDRPDVLLVVRDLFFRVKLEAGLRRLGLRSAAAGAEPLARVVRARRPRVAIVDLEDSQRPPLEQIRDLRADRDLADLPVLAFASHGARELHAAAREMGCTVVSRGRLSAALPQLVAPWVRGRASEG